MLMHRERTFHEAFQAFDYSTSVASPSLGLLTLWDALEHLFAPSKQELRFRVSALIASHLEAPGNARLELHRQLTKLYDARSEAAHTAKANSDVQAANATFQIAKRVLEKIIMRNQVPTRAYLDSLLFGVE